MCRRPFCTKHPKRCFFIPLFVTFSLFPLTFVSNQNFRRQERHGSFLAVCRACYIAIRSVLPNVNQHIRYFTFALGTKHCLAWSWMWCSVLDVWVKREGWRAYWSPYHNAATSLCNQQNIPLFILENVNEIYSVHLRNHRSLSDFIRTCDVCKSTYVGEKRTKPDESRQVPKFVRAFFMQIISIFGFKFAVIWKLPNTQETQPKMVKEAWNCDRKVQRTTYMHFVALLCYYLRFCQNIEHVSLN